MPTFEDLWKNHPGAGTTVCHESLKNQCAIRMTKALYDSGVDLSGYALRTCHNYSKYLRDHVPAHVLAAQVLADLLEKHPTLLGPAVKAPTKYTGSVNDNAEAIRGTNGVLFIQDGWDATDHIDVMNGTTFELKGGYSSYLGKGKNVWIWAM